MNIQAGQRFVKSYQTEEGSEISINYVVLAVTAKTVTVQREGTRESPLRRAVKWSGAKGAWHIKLEDYSSHRAYLDGSAYRMGAI